MNVVVNTNAKKNTHRQRQNPNNIKYNDIFTKFFWKNDTDILKGKIAFHGNTNRQIKKYMEM